MHFPSFFATLLLVGFAYTHAQPRFSFTLKPAGNYRTGVFAGKMAEIVAYDGFTKRLFSTNNGNKSVDVLDMKNINDPTLLFSIDLTKYNGAPNSAAVCNGLLAVALESDDPQTAGKLLLFTTWGECYPVNSIPTGAGPDMVKFSENGRFILVANKGLPNDEYTNDPEGTVTLVDLRKGPCFPMVKSVDFKNFNDRKEELLANGIRIFGPGATVAQDLEPEYIAVSHDSKTAWVTLQKNNAIAVIDIKTASVDTLLPLGYKDHLDPANKFDASDKDGIIYLNTWPVYGIYQPDAIAPFMIFGKTYLITANEGDSRDYPGYSEEERVKKLKLDPIAFPFAADLQKDKNLGRLKVTKSLGDIDGDGDYDKLYAFGGRSFSILSENGELVYESGSLLEEISAAYYPDQFNSNDEENQSFDGRSDDKGPEPEGIAIGKIGFATYAYICLERIGGIMIFDVSNPAAPQFIDYVNTRDFTGDPKTDGAGDLAPEGLIFIPGWQSPTFRPLVVSANEISGSIRIFEVVPKE